MRACMPLGAGLLRQGPGGCRKVYEGMLEKANTFGGPSDPEKLYPWSHRWMEAEQDASEKKTDRVAAAEGHLDRMKKREALYQGSCPGGKSTA
jgi:hypothetical protein